MPRLARTALEPQRFFATDALAHGLLQQRPMQTPRRHKRIVTRRAVQVELRRTSSSVALTTTPKKETFDAMTLDISAEGIGLDLTAGGDIGVGTTVRVTFKLGARSLTLPGQVAWTTLAGDGSRAGLKLHLAVTDGATRRAYDGFVRDVEKAANAQPSR